MKLKIIFAVILISGLAFAHSVTMNLAFKIGGKNNTIHVNGTDYSMADVNATTFTSLEKKYISSNTSSAVAALVFAGSKFLSVHLNTTYSNDEYLVQMKQESDAKFILALTKGAWQGIDEKAYAAESNHIIPKTFGAFAYAARSTFLYYLRLEYAKIDLSTRARWGSGDIKLLIKGMGREGRGIFNVTTEVT